MRILPLVQGLVVADSVIAPAQGGLLDADDLRARSAERPSTRGDARQRWVWAHADGRSESPGETYSRAVVLWSGFEHPDLQREYRYEGHLDRSDFFFPSVRCVGESDGWGKYRLDDPDAAARHLTDEKRREDRLRRNGHPFARWDLDDARRVDPLCRALSLAGVPRTRPAQPAMLATLRSAPRLVRP